MVAEGVKTATTALELAKRHDVEMPICNEVKRVIDGEQTAADAFRGLTRMPVSHERDPW